VFSTIWKVQFVLKDAVGLDFFSNALNDGLNSIQQLARHSKPMRYYINTYIATLTDIMQ
jgi:hypothetical protein